METENKIKVETPFSARNWIIDQLTERIEDSKKRLESLIKERDDLCNYLEAVNIHIDHHNEIIPIFEQEIERQKSL